MLVLVFLEPFELPPPFVFVDVVTVVHDASFNNTIVYGTVLVEELVGGFGRIGSRRSTIIGQRIADVVRRFSLGQSNDASR